MITKTTVGLCSQIIIEPAELSLKLQLPFESHSYQKEAMKKWSEKKKGLLVLPTGSGKSIFGCNDYGKNQSFYFSCSTYHRATHSVAQELKRILSVQNRNARWW